MNAAKLVTLECMLAELESACLHVLLAPAPYPTHEGHCVRVVANKNARWYRDFCAQYRSTRRRKNPRTDTAIRRRNTIAALQRMIAGVDSGTIYAERLTIAARAYYRRNRAALCAQIEAAA
jgi:hypothetical protein